MHLITFLFITVEVIIFAYQLIYYLSRPSDKARLYYLMLIIILIIYNIASGLFPDSSIPIAMWLQMSLAYGTGMSMGAYLPFYFYKAFGLDRIRFDAIYGIFIFMLCPFFLVFGVTFFFSQDLDSAINYALIFPFIYAIKIASSIFIAIWDKFSKDAHKTKKLFRLIFKKGKFHYII